MTYTINLDLFIDGDEILSEKTISEFLKEQLESASINAKNIKLIEVND